MGLGPTRDHALEHVGQPRPRLDVVQLQLQKLGQKDRVPWRGVTERVSPCSSAGLAGMISVPLLRSAITSSICTSYQKDTFTSSASPSACLQLSLHPPRGSRRFARR